MARSRYVALDQIGAELQRFVKRTVAEDSQVLRTKVAHEVAERTLWKVVQKAQDELGPDGTGEYARGFEVVRTHKGFDVENDVPYAGVIELGRRRMRPGPPIEAIREFVERRGLGGSAEERERIAQAIRWKIHRDGTPPRRFLGDTVDENWDRWIADAVELHIERRRRT